MALSQAAETSLSYNDWLAQLTTDLEKVLWGPSYSTGTRVLALIRNRWRAYLITDLTDLTSLADSSKTQIVNTVGGGSAFVGAIHTAGEIALGVKVSGGVAGAIPVPVSLAAGQAVNATITAVSAGIANPLLQKPSAWGLAAPTIVQVATGAAGILLTGPYSEVHIKNIGVNTVWLGFDATVSAITGYPLEKLGIDDEIILPGVGANESIWTFSALASTVAVIARF